MSVYYKEKSNPMKGVVKNFALHIHPKKIDIRALKFTRTFGLGGISFLLIVILFVTGLILRFSYIPTTTNAYNSILNLQNNSIFGKLIRNIHHLSSQLLICTTFLHLIRVYYSQSIYGIRAKNWVYGLILFLLVVVANFTGYLLPWDQLSYWAITIFTQIIENMPVMGSWLADTVRGGKSLGNNTLLRFYTIHTGVLPVLFVFFTAIHFWLIRRAKGVALPLKKEQESIRVYPYLVKLETMVGIIVLASIMVIAVFYDAPFQEPANPQISPNPGKAVWYFLGVQELLIHLHPTFSTIIVPFLCIVFLLFLPYLKNSNVNVGVWFNSNSGKKSIFYTIAFSFTYTFILIYSLEHFINAQIRLYRLSAIIKTGIIPFLLYIIPISVFIYIIKKVFVVPSVEVVMMIATVIFSSYLCMMFISLFLRGEGMQLIF